MNLDRLAAAEQETPQWRPWILMLRHLSCAMDDPVWLDPVPGPHAGDADQPLLAGKEIRVPDAAVAQLVQRLSDVANAGAVGSSEARDCVLNAAAIPLFGACANQLARWVPAHWPHGYCPICGAWPVLAELVGLDRSRRLRCGRCGIGWQARMLTCTFCGEADHSRLGALVSQAAPDGPRVETCRSCMGYLKTIPTLTEGSHFDVLLADLESVALDLAAQEAGFVRPAAADHAVGVELSPSGFST